MKKSKLILLIIGIVLVIIGITYAVFTWVVPALKITGSSECFDLNVKYAKGKDIGSDDKSKTLLIGGDYKSGLSTTITVSLGSTCTINTGKGTLYLNTDSITSNNLLTSGALKYQIMSGTTNLGSGVISSTGNLAIANNVALTTSPKNITVYVWVDGNVLTEEQMLALLDTKYKGSINMKIESDDK